MKIATAAYNLDLLDTWDAFEQKARRWVSQAKQNNADLLVFPEYGAMELATLGGPDAIATTQASLHAISERIPQADKIWTALAQEFNVHLLTPSAPVFDTAIHPDRPVNRTRLIAPNGKSGVQDKQIMTLFERAPMDVIPGGGLQIFDTALGKIGVLICYDAEFPMLGRALIEAGAQIILCPSCTEALAGYWRVRIGAMARALEGQCVTVMSSVVGTATWSDVVEQNTGMGGVFGPPDTGFPSSGVIAEGSLNTPGWTYAEITLDAISHVRTQGIVRNASHWRERSPDPVTLPVTYCSLS